MEDSGKEKTGSESRQVENELDKRVEMTVLRERSAQKKGSASKRWQIFPLLQSLSQAQIVAYEQ